MAPFFFKDENDPAWKNAQQGYEKVKRLDQEKHQLVWLTPGAGQQHLDYRRAPGPGGEK